MQTTATVVLTAAAWGVWLHACSIAATAVAEQLQAVLEWKSLAFAKPTKRVVR
jgi:hypothetical protein